MKLADLRPSEMEIKLKMDYRLEMDSGKHLLLLLFSGLCESAEWLYEENNPRFFGRNWEY